MQNHNFISARRMRRKVVQELQDQQKRDSFCSENLRVVISRHTKAILNIVSDLLMSYQRANISEPDRLLFQKLAPSSQDPELWLQYREDEADTAKVLARLQQLVSSAESEYSRLAPFGKTVTGWFSDEREKAQIAAAKLNRDSLRRECEEVSSKHQVKMTRIHDYAEDFLRNAMRPEGMAILLKNPRVQTQLQLALDMLTRDVTELWRTHTAAQNKSLNKVVTAISELGELYRAESENFSTSLLGKSKCCNP